MTTSTRHLTIIKKLPSESDTMRTSVTENSINVADILNFCCSKMIRFSSKILVISSKILIMGSKIFVIGCKTLAIGSKIFVIGSKANPVTSITSDASGIIFLKKRENPANIC